MKTNRSLIFLLILMGLSLSPAEEPQQAEPADPEVSLDQTNLLFIIPRDRLDSNVWSRLDADHEAGAVQELTDGKSIQTIYYVETPSTPAAQSRFEKSFGSDWTVVPVNEEQNMFRLIATHLPEPVDTMPPVRIDPTRISMKELAVAPTWVKGSVPRSIVLKWAELWQSETEATPVVIVLVRF